MSRRRTVSSDQSVDVFVLPGECDRVVPLTTGSWREGTPSMDPRSDATGAPEPDAIEFVRFCYRRRRVGWPELYDEMCAVAGRHLFRGYDADDLAGIGIGFSLFDMPALSILSGRIIAEEQALRRPVAVTITPEVALAGPTATAPEPKVEERSIEVPIRLALAPA